MDSCNNKRLDIGYEEYGYPLLFFLSLTLLGLECPVGYFFLAAILYYSYKHNRYDFLLQSTLLFGVFGYYNENIAFPFKLADIALVISLIGAYYYRKNKIIGRLLLLTIIYYAFIFLVAFLSEESFSIQIRRMRQYMQVIYFIYPLLVFANQKFDVQKLFKHILIYVTIVSIFIICDSLVFSNHILLPRTASGTLTYETLSFIPFERFVRVYPPVIYLIALLVFPFIKKYKMPLWNLVIIGIGVICTKTFSIMFGLILTYFFFYGNWKKKLSIVGVVAVLLFFGNIADKELGGALRINQLFDQFGLLTGSKDIMDDMDDLAEFGSGRGAQIIPKLELLTNTSKQMFGFGFLHDKLTQNDDFYVDNQYYSDSSSASEVASFVEVTQVQTILDMGFMGLIVQTAFFIMIYVVIRKYKYRSLYSVTTICISLFGLGGFAGLNSPQGLLIIGLSLGSIILINRNDEFENINNNTDL